MYVYIYSFVHTHIARPFVAASINAFHYETVVCPCLISSCCDTTALAVRRFPMLLFYCIIFDVSNVKCIVCGIRVCTFCHTHIHAHTYTYTYIHIYIYMYTYAYIHIYICIYIHIYTYIYIHIHTCMHAYIHTYIHI